jgi:hypothetical protein
MAFIKHDTARDQYGNPPRDATGTDPHSHSVWSYVVGMVIVALLAFAIFGSLTSTNLNTSPSPTVSSEPASPPAATPAPSPSQAP